MGSKTNTTTQSTTPPAALLAQYQDLIGRASGQSQNGQAPYSPFNSTQNAAFGSIGSIPGQYLPQAESYAAQGAAPITAGQIQGYTNPFQTDVTNATEANINETNAEQQNQVTGNAIAQGALGGNRVGVAQGELARQQGLANNATLAGLNATNYDQALQAAQADRAAAAGTAGTYAGLEGTALQGAEAELGAGTQQQDYANQGLQFPYQNLDWLSQIEGQTGPLEGNTSQTTQPGPNILSQLFGSALAVAGMPGSSAGGQGLSSLMSMFAASRGGGISIPHRAVGGGIGVPFGIGMSGGIGTPQQTQAQPNGRAGSMVANALNLARTMKAGMGGMGGMGGIGTPHFDAGGGVGTMVPAIPGFADWDTTPTSDPTSVAATAALGDMGAQGWLGAPSVAQAAGIGTPSPPVYTPGAPNPPPANFNPYTPAFPAIPGQSAAPPVPRLAPTPPSSPAASGIATGAPMQLAGADPLDQYARAIASNETGGQKDPYSYVEPSSGAIGKYQVMPANVPSWTKQVLGTAMTPQQFLANPQAQEAVFKGIFGQYLQQTGDPNKAAAMWFGGPGVNAKTGPDALGTTVAGYVQKFNDALNGGASPAGGAGIPSTATVAAAGPGGIATPGTAGTPAPGIGHGQLLKAFLNRPGNQTLTDVGLGIMGGTSPFFGTNVGQGAMQGLDMARQLQQLQAQINYQQELVGIRGEQTQYNTSKPFVIGKTPFGQPIYATGGANSDGSYNVVDANGNPTGATADGSGNVTAVNGQKIPDLLPATDPGYATNEVIPGIPGSTSATINAMARSYLETGTLPNVGTRGAAGQMLAQTVVAEASRIAPNGIPAENKAQFSAASKSLNTQETYLNNVQRAFNTANQTLSQLTTYMDQNGINPSQFPDLNSVANELSRRGADPGVIAAFRAGVASLQAEYSQVLSRGGARSVETDNSAKALIPDNLNPADLTKVAQRLQQEGTTAIGSAQSQVKQIEDQIHSLGGGESSAADAAAPAAAPSASSGVPAATPAAAGSSSAPAPADGTIAHPTSQADYDALPKGTQYVDPKNGKTYVKQ